MYDMTKNVNQLASNSTKSSNSENSNRSDFAVDLLNLHASEFVAIFLSVQTHPKLHGRYIVHDYRAAQRVSD